MYSIDSEKIISIGSDGTATVRAEIWAASTQDVPAYDAIAGKVLAEGSTVIIPSESKILILDFDHNWKEWGAEESEVTE